MQKHSSCPWKETLIKYKIWSTGGRLSVWQLYPAEGVWAFYWPEWKGIDSGECRHAHMFEDLVITMHLI